MGGLWPGTGGSVRVSVYNALSSNILPHTSSPIGTGRNGADMAEAASVCVSPDCSAPRSSGEGPLGRSECSVGSPVLAKPSVVFGPNIPSRRLSSGASGQEGPSISCGGAILHPRPETFILWVWPLRGSDS